MPEINLHNMDCMEGLSETEDSSYGLVITSPPYNLGNNHHTGNKRHKPYEDDMPEDKYQEWQIEILDECYRVLDDTGSMFYNHKNRIKNGLMISPLEWILKSKFYLKQELVWFNRSQNFDKCRFYPMTERVYWLSKMVKTEFHNDINHHDLFEWQAEGTDKEHKRAYPKQMVTDILQCFPSGTKVLDPFIGSGTTAIACYDLGFSLTGYEIDKDYFEAMTKRFEKHKQQLTLDLKA